MDYGKEIRMRRAELDISQGDIAEHCKTTKQNISRYENGKVKEPDYRLLIDIYSYLGLNHKQFDKYVGSSVAHSTEPVSKSLQAEKPDEIDLLREEVRQLRKIVDALTVQLINKIQQ